jgi:hypothetical protein
MIIHELLKPEDVPFGGEESLTDTARFFVPMGNMDIPEDFIQQLCTKSYKKRGFSIVMGILQPLDV